MTRNQRLSRAMMYSLISTLCGASAILHIWMQRWGTATVLMSICMISFFFTMFNREEAKHL